MCEPVSTDVGTKLPMVTGPRLGADASPVGGGTPAGCDAGCESTADGALLPRSSSSNARSGAQLFAAVPRVLHWLCERADGRFGPLDCACVAAVTP